MDITPILKSVYDMKETNRIESYLEKTFQLNGKIYAVMPIKDYYYDFENECYYTIQNFCCDYDYNIKFEKTFTLPGKHPLLVDITGLTKEEAIEKLKSSKNPHDSPNCVENAFDNLAKSIIDNKGPMES